jgi:hypothetical protein
MRDRIRVVPPSPTFRPRSPERRRLGCCRAGAVRAPLGPPTARALAAASNGRDMASTRSCSSSRRGPVGPRQPRCRSSRARSEAGVASKCCSCRRRRAVPRRERKAPSGLVREITSGLMIRRLMDDGSALETSKPCVQGRRVTAGPVGVDKTAGFSTLLSTKHDPPPAAPLPSPAGSAAESGAAPWQIRSDGRRGPRPRGPAQLRGPPPSVCSPAAPSVVDLPAALRP